MLIDRAMLSLVACASDEASRPSLRGVHFERPAADKPGRAVATDCHILAIVEEPPGVSEADFPARFPDLDASRAAFSAIVPTETCKAVAKALPKKAPRHILKHALLAEGETALNGHSVLAVTDLDNDQVFKPKKPMNGDTPATFPDIDRVVPPAPTAEHPALLRVTLSAELIAALAEVAKATALAWGAASGASTALTFTFMPPEAGAVPSSPEAKMEWSGAVRVTGPERFTAVIMPMRR